MLWDLDSICSVYTQSNLSVKEIQMIPGGINCVMTFSTRASVEAVAFSKFLVSVSLIIVLTGHRSVISASSECIKCVRREQY